MIRINIKKITAMVALLFSCLISQAQTGSTSMMEQYRPQFHFSPKAHWMNDPNGMVYLNGVYHLFFQYYPDSTVWGPMHWGHATSKDMVTWQEQPIALYPDSLGYIFSGSAVVDINNTSGFGKNGKAPLVAIFTHHNTDGEKANTNDFQNQSLAYSNDEGKTWTKYAGNPVVKNPGVRDFRDPKVMWYEAGKKWVMTLATQDRITFYSSLDLKTWKKESEFGKTIGAHGGVWECPDLFQLEVEGKKVWVLLVSINPGGPNGGSATQYFTGQFNGHEFKVTDTVTRFMDYGTDNYAGVTFSNTGNRKVLIGWMSNWQYAQVVPTVNWRSAMTVPRELSLKRSGSALLLASTPVKELDSRMKPSLYVKNKLIKGNYTVATKGIAHPELFKLNLSKQDANDFEVILSNEAGEKIVVGFDKKANQYYIDRGQSGSVDFEKGFGKKHVAPRLTKGPVKLTLIADAASVELFTDDGLTVMTDIFFPNQPLNQLNINSATAITINGISYLSK